MRKILVTIISLVFTLFLAVGCAAPAAPASEAVSAPDAAFAPAADEGSLSKQYAPPAADAAAELPASEAPLDPETEEAQSVAGGGAIGTPRKVVKAVSYSIETMEYDKDKMFLEQRVATLGGYVEKSEMYGMSISEGGDGRQMQMVAWVPSDRYNSFLNEIEGNTGKIVSKNQSGQDVTQQYYDTEARVKTLKLQQERMEAILAKAEKLDDIIKLDKEITRIQTEVESLTETLRRLDNIVDMSRIDIVLTEKEPIKIFTTTETTLGERIGKGLSATLSGLIKFFEGFLVFIVAALPVLIILAIIAVIILLIIRRNNRKNRERRRLRDETKADTKE